MMCNGPRYARGVAQGDRTRSSRPVRPRPIRQCAAAVAALLAISACAPVVATRGNMVDDQRLDQVQVGSTTATQIASLLGTPTAVGTFDPTIWYYIGQRMEQTAFFAPDVTMRRVVVVDFDQRGVVREVAQLGLDDGEDIALVSRETPTRGRSIGFLEQILGNLGRIGNADVSAGTNQL